jgi:hypothetical protein
MTIVDGHRSEPQLLRLPYQSAATSAAREFFVYLPVDYDAETAYRWPVILFLHGGGERGDGHADLDYVLHSGSLGEAWIRHRNLPFVMIGPQLPLFDMDWQLQLRAGVPKPVRRVSDPAPCNVTARPDHPIMRATMSVGRAFVKVTLSA